MARDAARKYDAGAAAFFVESLCQDVDLVLRFGFALALDEDKALRLVQRTYASIVPEIPELLDAEANKIRLKILRRAWELFHEEPEEGKSQNSLARMLASLEQHTRACLFLVDVFGLTYEEARSITKMEENEFRSHIAQGRRKMMQFRFE